MALTQFDLILAAIRGVSLTRDEASDLHMAISARVDSVEGDSVIPKSTTTAECALAAVYAAIEAQAGHQDANLVGLAALVTALSAFPTGTLMASGEVAYTEPLKDEIAPLLEAILLAVKNREPITSTVNIKPPQYTEM